MPDREDIVELSGQAGGSGGSDRPAGPTGRPYLRLFFRCANQYQRAYKSADGTGYSARCTKCGQTIRFRVGEGGTSERSFTVSCQ